jgi:chromosome segregation ATPase
LITATIPQANKAQTIMASFQARITLLRLQIAEIKQELKIIMSDLEKTNLEAHVDLCAERYKGLHDRLSAIEYNLKRLSEDMLQGQKSHGKTLIMTAGTVVAGLLSTIVVVLMKFN